MALRIASSTPRIGRFSKRIKFLYVSNGAKYFVSFYLSYHPATPLVSVFFLSFPKLRKIVFTGTIAILDSVHWFSQSNKTFSQKLDTDSESAQKTESNEVSFKLI